ncbi:MAG: biopolymer transporter ExbD [Rikenellaceae bacterium]
MAKKQVQEINASSMADIAFLLLIFFLVTTTMNVDSGISRVLPPIVDNPQDDGIKVKERNVLAIKVSGNNMILVGGERVDLQRAKEIVKEFSLNVLDSETLPEKEEVDIPLIGKYMVSKGVISLQNDRSTSYEVYLDVQNELTKAMNEMRQDFSQRQFQTDYEELTKEQRKAVNTAIPTKISEAEPVDLTGK